MLVRGNTFGQGPRPTRLDCSHLKKDVLSPLGPTGGAAAGSNLKEIRIRIKSVKSIEKITKTMKMIASSRLKAAQNKMESNRAFFDGGSKLLEVLKTTPEKNNLLVPLFTDRGLCGAINTSIAKNVKATVSQKIRDGKQEGLRMICIGDKANSLMVREFGSYVKFSVGDLGKRPLTFAGVGVLTEKIMQETWDTVSVTYNHFESVVAYSQKTIHVPSPSILLGRAELDNYDFEEDQRIFHVQDLVEFEIGSSIYHAYCENAAAELGARVSAMDSASRNASDMLKRLNITYNRGRQAAITTELTEIISGAAAVQ